MDAYIRSWHQKLRKECEAANRPTLTRNPESLECQIKTLLAGLSPALLNRPWAIEEIVRRLRGKYRDRPHPQDVAAILKALGWKQTRDWSQTGQGRRYWHWPKKPRANT